MATITPGGDPPASARTLFQGDDLSQESMSLASRHAHIAIVDEEDPSFIFNRLVTQVLGLPASHACVKALAHSGIDNVEDFASLPEQSLLDELYLEREDGSETKLPIIQGRSLVCFQHFLKSYNLWDSRSLNLLNRSDFNKFRLSPDYRPTIGAVGTSASVVSADSSTRAGDSSAVKDFRKSIKRDVNQYPILKDPRYFDQFELKLLTIAKSHDVAQVFDPTYRTLHPEDKPLFDEKCKFVMTVLVHCMQTDIGISFVREHIRDSNAQECWRKIVEEARSSTRAELVYTDLLGKFLQTKIDSFWKGTTTGFLLHWKEMLRKLDSLAKDGEKYPESMRKILLISAVNGHPMLASVDQLDRNQITRGLGAMPFQQYYDILLSTASQSDHSNVSIRPKSKRLVNYLDLTDDDYSYLSSPDSDHSLVEVFNARSSLKPFAGSDPNSTYVPREVWEKLPPKVQEILRESRDPTKNKTVARSVNQSILNDHPTYDDDNPDHLGVVEEESEQEPDNGDDDNEPDLMALLVNKTETGGERLTPGDIRRVLAASQKSREQEINVAHGKNHPLKGRTK